MFAKANWKHKRLLFGLITAAVIMTLAQAGFFIVTAQILDQLVDNNWKFSDYWGLISLTALFIGLRLVFMVAYSYCDWMLYSASRKELEKQVFTATTNRPEHFYSDNFTGALVADASKFVSGYKSTNSLAFDYGIQTIMTVLIACIVVGFISLPMAAAMIVLSSLYVVVSVFKSIFSR